MFKKLLLTLLCSLMAISMVACSNDGAKLSFTQGTYEGVAKGMKGDLKVEVTLSEDAITNIEVVEHNETYGIGYGLKTSPVEVIPTQIIENQSLAVEMVSGATITSAAVRNAVTAALETAGADVAALKSKEIKKEAVKDETLEADVVIAGAGVAGLAAGIEAARAGANVIIVEKSGVTGGATARSGGKILAAGSKWQEAQDITDSPELMFEYMQSMNGSEQLNDEMVLEFCENSVENMNWLEDMGVMMYDVEAIHKSLNPWRVHNTTNKEGHAGGGMTDGFGGNITVPMTEEFENNNGQIIYNAAANEILVDENGAVSGLKALKNDGSTLTINAKNVIVATGGYAQNKEMMKRYEATTAGFVTSVPSGNVGDGITMGEAIGAKIYEAPTTQTVYLDFNSGVGINEEAGLILDAKGNRIVNEYSYQYHVADAITKSGSVYGWYIATVNDTTPTVQYAMSLDKTLKASTIEELATLMEVDATTLKATIDRYNTLAANGNDEDFGKPADKMYPVEGDMYFALKLKPNVTVTFGGLVTDKNAQVLDTNEEVIEGLYAAGETAFTGLFADEYPCCGMAIGGAVYYGRIAGRLAAENK